MFRGRVEGVDLGFRVLGFGFMFRRAGAKNTCGNGAPTQGCGGRGSMSREGTYMAAGLRRGMSRCACLDCVRLLRPVVSCVCRGLVAGSHGRKMDYFQGSPAIIIGARFLSPPPPPPSCELSPKPLPLRVSGCSTCSVWGSTLNPKP